MSGWKQWQQLEVVTQSDLQNYIQDQVVQVYANSAARSTALSTNVTPGMVSYLQDTQRIEVRTNTGWISIPVVSDTPVSPNYIINGAFDFWQRGTSFTTSDYGADRFRTGVNGNTIVYSQQTFTPAEVSAIGFGSAQFYARVVNTSVAGAGNFTQILQRVEDVRNLAGQTVTFSYWAKADAAKSVAIELSQSFGSGGSASVNTFIAKQALTTSWARYSHTFTIPSISGKTIGTGSFNDFRFWLDAGSNFNSRTDSLGQQNITFDIWGVQLEAGSVATPFRRNANSLQGELAACQRYYYRISPLIAGNHFGSVYMVSTTQARLIVPLPVSMRIAPTALEQSGTAGDYRVFHKANTSTICSSVPSFIEANPNSTSTLLTVSTGLTAGEGGQGQAQVSTAFLAWSAEL